MLLEAESYVCYEVRSRRYISTYAASDRILSPLVGRFDIRNRRQANLDDIYWSLTALLALSVMGALVRKPNTRLLRLGLMPIALYVTIMGGFGVSYFDPRAHKAWNFLVGEQSFFDPMWDAFLSFLFTANVHTAMIGKALMWGCGSQQFTVEEAQNKSTASAMNRSAGGGKMTKGFQPKNKRSLIYDLFDAYSGMRGLGWEFGANPKVYIPKHTRPVDQGRLPFVIPTVANAVVFYFLLDCVDCFMKTIPGVNTPEGGTIFLPSLHPVFRYSYSFIITYLTGHIIPFYYTYIYDVCSIIMVGIFNDSPEMYPPMFDSPWTATSVSSFWGKTWHQMVRQTFFIMGGFPLQYIFALLHPALASTGLLIGTFLGSGIFHSLVLLAMDGKLGYNTLSYFMFQAIIVASERILYVNTGYKPRGFVGHLWSLLSVVGTAQYLGKGSLSPKISID